MLSIAADCGSRDFSTYCGLRHRPVPLSCPCGSLRLAAADFAFASPLSQCGLAHRKSSSDALPPRVLRPLRRIAGIAPIASNCGYCAHCVALRSFSVWTCVSCGLVYTVKVTRPPHPHPTGPSCFVLHPLRPLRRIETAGPPRRRRVVVGGRRRSTGRQPGRPWPRQRSAAAAALRPSRPARDERYGTREAIELFREVIRLAVAFMSGPLVTRKKYV